MRAMIVKEFRQLRRDRRTLAMMIVMPVLLLVILGYAASFDVSDIPTVVAGPRRGRRRDGTAEVFPGGGDLYRDGRADRGSHGVGPR